jgi:5-formyltetrahydrofolate cyclo-ligase
MRYYDYTPSALQSGYCGIDEPMGDEECLVEDIDLIVVPARAFTTAGVRMGRGGGFYDRYMSLEGFRAYKVGVAFECQIFEELPSDRHDIMVDEVIYA